MTDRLKGFLLYVLPLILYCTGIFILSSAPLPELPDFGFDFQDKLNHIVAYGLMTLLAYRAATWIGRDMEWSRGKPIALAVLFVAFYGVSDEFHQMYVPGRSSEIYDWLADVAGALLAIPALHYLSRTRLAYQVKKEQAEHQETLH